MANWAIDNVMAVTESSGYNVTVESNSMEICTYRCSPTRVVPKTASCASSQGSVGVRYDAHTMKDRQEHERASPIYTFSLQLGILEAMFPLLSFHRLTCPFYCLTSRFGPFYGATNNC